MRVRRCSTTTEQESGRFVGKHEGRVMIGSRIGAKWDLEMHPESVPELAERYHLRLGPPPSPHA